MKHFLVRYTHTDFEGWKKHLMPHLQFIKDHLKSGDLLISGPLQDSPKDKKEAFLIFKVKDREHLQTIIEKDPYWTEKLVSDYQINEFNPLFGLLGYSGEKMEEGMKNPELVAKLLNQ